jgi:glycosyltransferase involved in cell wall biosynthesis
MNDDVVVVDSFTVSIGMPVYNGEIFIRKALNSLINQSHSNFQLIISDNASTDKTSEICQEFVKKDNRIHYIRQEKNIGANNNFKFVLEQSKANYFFWAAVDDYWESDFIKKNMEILHKNKNVVCSISKLDTYGFSDSELKKFNIPTVNYPNFLKKFVMNRRKRLISTTFPISGTFSQKIRKYIKNPGASSWFYGIYRTKEIRTCLADKSFIGVEFVTSFNLLKIGNFYELDEILFHRFDSGWSTYGLINMAKKSNGTFFGIVFPFYPFTFWCIKNLGLKNVFRNLDIFLKMNLSISFFLLVDIIFILKMKLQK